MTDPKWARPTDKGRYYEDPKTGDLLVSVTNVLDSLAIRGLAPSAADLTARYVMDNIVEASQVAAETEAREEFIKRAKRHYEDEWERRMNLGSAIHAAAEAHVLGGQQRPISPLVAPFLAQYLKFLDDYQVDLNTDVEAVENTVLHRGRHYGGTADLWVHLTLPPPHPSGLWLLDLKSSVKKPASVVYPQQPLQLAALRNAEVALNPYDQDKPIPKFVGAAILNLRPWAYGLIPVDADHNAYRAFVSLLPTVQWLHGWSPSPYKPINTGWRKPRNWDKKHKEVAA
ncbi:hypothetical protein ABZ470_39840 [Streptosporangium sp. NPDC020072]|uniref:hypothetical protein n=1 Tax=Streptosporangium sp. NPDC020072 TaxID=3154788 RepID=UPI0034451BEE